MEKLPCFGLLASSQEVHVFLQAPVGKGCMIVENEGKVCKFLCNMSSFDQLYLPAKCDAIIQNSDIITEQNVIMQHHQISFIIQSQVPICLKMISFIY